MANPFTYVPKEVLTYMAKLWDNPEIVKMSIAYKRFHSATSDIINQRKEDLFNGLADAMKKAIRSIPYLCEDPLAVAEANGNKILNNVLRDMYPTCLKEDQELEDTYGEGAASGIEWDEDKRSTMVTQEIIRWFDIIIDKILQLHKTIGMERGMEGWCKGNQGSFLSIGGNISILDLL